MPETKTFSIYDKDGEKAVVTLTGHTIHDATRGPVVRHDNGDIVAGVTINEGYSYREIGV